MDNVTEPDAGTTSAQSSAKPLLGEGSLTPDFLRLSSIPVNYVQQLETDLLEPVVFNQGSATSDGFCRFTLQNKGFLHSHSKIFVGLKLLDGSNDAAGDFPMPHIGIGQVVKKAVLKIGNKAINEIDAWRHLFAAKSTLITNENNLERELYMTGRGISHDFNYTTGSRFEAAGYGLDNGLETDAEGVVSDVEIPEWLRITSDDKTNPSLSIDLSDLFPFLKVNQLPLYMITEPINIELTFYPQVGERVQIKNGQTANILCDIVRDDLKFCADYIYYGATDEMERYAAANPEINFSFVDYRVVESSTTRAALQSSVVRNLGMANRIVPRVLTAISDSSVSEDGLLGEVNALAPLYNASGVVGVVTKTSYNLKYNDRYEYTTAIDNSARLFSEFTNSEGIPFITRQEFSDECKAGGMSGTYAGHDQDTELSGQFFNLGTKLTNGRVGQRGVDLFISGDFPAGTDIMRNFCEYVRVATLRDGMFEIYNA
tara:strand:- start:2724 stop:4181 length:1458 start_codon:yes stop_codon:yes gene_type:complete